MKTITFYSYKGGVGRSLALSRIAIRLSELGKKVCVLDFDLDAPGLRFKFVNYVPSRDITRGIVDHIYDFSKKGKIGLEIQDLVVELNPSNATHAPISFISAGDINSSDYWKKLSMINWAEMFYGEHPHGVEFFLDLKSKIETDISPDYFLIDSRTGITDISGITLRLLADQVVVMAVHNTENLFGSKKIIKNLLSRSFPGMPPKINFVLSRLPYTPAEIDMENKVIEDVREEFEELFELADFPISVIHSDEQIQIDEAAVGSRESDKKKPSSTTKDYLDLFDSITKDSLNSNEFIEKAREAESDHSRYMMEKDPAARMRYISRAISLNPNKYEYWAYRGIEYFKLKEFDKAITDYLRAIELNPNDPVLRLNLGVFYQWIKDYDRALYFLDQADPDNERTHIAKSKVYEAMGELDKAISSLHTAIELDPMNDQALNSRAHQLRLRGDYEEAFVDVSRAIEINSGVAHYFATLAEIYAMQGKLSEFYLNISIALSKGVTAAGLKSASDVYEKFRGDPRFEELLRKNNLFIEDIFEGETEE
ncbi:KGGVGR-motif variant AAA ATPase [Pedobacter miscanthi]|uniref:KGGVGR-motif variant AAA ATPase n=1 Tax=Pedobacter miscanthi TaxID=2259170 RepID=UPI002931CAF1|nr:tetratricopeptide repeat protein [Pedobacter miscanthi]